MERTRPELGPPWQKEMGVEGYGANKRGLGVGGVFNSFSIFIGPYEKVLVVIYGSDTCTGTFLNLELLVNATSDLILERDFAW